MDLHTGRYETMIVLRPDMTDEERCASTSLLPSCSFPDNYGLSKHVDIVIISCRDSELAKFEAFLSKLGGSNTRAMVRGRQRLAYPISKCASVLLRHLAAITACILY